MSHVRLEREAIRWLLRIKTAEPEDEIWSDFQTWLDDPAHRAMYLRVERAWNQLEDAVMRSVKHKRPRRTRRRKRD